MPLNWNVKNCENYESLLEGDEWAATETLIFALGMLSVGGSVTESNAPEVFARISAYEEAEGALRRDHTKPPGQRDVFFTPQEIAARVGLSTNWGDRRESRATWIKRVLDAKTSQGIAARAAEYRQAVA